MAQQARRRTSRKKEQKLSNNHIVVLSLVAVLVSSFGTFMLLDSGVLNLSGAATTDTAILSLTVAGAAGCALEGTNNSVTFTSVTPGTTVTTSGGDADGGTLIVNNTGNVLLNVSVNSTNTSTSGEFFSGTTTPTSYQIAAGSDCAAGVGDAGTITSLTAVSTLHRTVVTDFGFSDGDDGCTIDFSLAVPGDEPVGTKLDLININCTNG